MTRKDYELIAATIYESLDKFIQGTTTHEAHRDYAYQLAHDMADKLKAENPRFDTDKFVKACGFPEGSCY